MRAAGLAMAYYYFDFREIKIALDLLRLSAKSD